jgi:aldehyde dehydrogenase (NAD+)
LNLYEPLGVVGVACPNAPPLLGFISLVAPLLAVGNRCVALPAPAYPGIASVLDDLFDVTALPATALRIVGESRPGLATALAAHDRLDGLWYHAAAEHAGEVGMAAAENGIVTWIEDGRARDWWSVASGEGGEFLRAATRLKTIRIPYGD